MGIGTLMLRRTLDGQIPRYTRCANRMCGSPSCLSCYPLAADDEGCTQDEHNAAVADPATWETWIEGPTWEEPWGDVVESAHCPRCGSTRQRLIAEGVELQEDEADAA